MRRQAAKSGPTSFHRTRIDRASRADGIEADGTVATTDSVTRSALRPVEEHAPALVMIARKPHTGIEQGHPGWRRAVREPDHAGGAGGMTESIIDRVGTDVLVLKKDDRATAPRLYE